MRIDCEQCGAAYSIDDALITDRGVRAQCPKCAHQKVVKRPRATPAPTRRPLPGAAAPPAFPPSQTPNPFAPRGTPNPFAGIGAQGNPRRPAENSPPAPSAGGNPFGGGPLGDPFAPGRKATPAAENPFANPRTTNNGAPVGNPFETNLDQNPQTEAQSAFGLTAPPTSNPFASPFPAASPADPFGASSPSASANENLFGAAGPPLPTPGPAPHPFGSSFPGGTPSPQPSPFQPTHDPFANINPHEPDLGSAPAPNPFAASRADAPSDPFASLGPKAGGDDPFASLGQPQQSPFGQSAFGQSSFGEPPFGQDSGRAAPDSDPFSSLGIEVDTSSAVPSSAFGDAGATIRPPGGAPDLRAPPRAESFAEDSGRSSASKGDRWHVKTAAGMDAEVDLPQLKQLVRNGDVRANDEAAPLGQPLKRVSTQPALQLPPAEKSGSQRVAGARARAAPSFGRVAAAVAVVAVVMLGGGLYLLKPELFEAQSSAGANPLRRAKPSWEKQFPGVGGTAEAHLRAGRGHMALDTAEGYQKADEELRQALILDIGNVPAIAAWVENLTHLPAMRADLEGVSLAREAIAYAAARDSHPVEVKRAEAALLLATDQVDAAQKLLFEARDLEPDNVDTLVLLARSQVERDPKESLRLVEAVRAKDDKLPIVFIIEGGAKRRLGDFDGARAAIAARLRLDPRNTNALRELAQLELDIGRPQEAIAALTKLIGAEKRDVDAHLTRAKIEYQLLGTPDGLQMAEAHLTKVLQEHDADAGELLLPVLSNAAFVKAELGKLDEALTLGERARATDGSFPPALFVLGRIYALKGNGDEAKKALELAVRAAQTRDNFYEPVARAELARVQALFGDSAQAIRNYQQVIDYDPRYLRAYFGLAAVHMAAEEHTQAMTVIRRAFDYDPHFDADRPVLTDYPTPLRDLVAFADAFKGAQVPASDSSLRAQKNAAEAMIRYQAGQRAAAETLARRSLGEDRFNLMALSTLGVLELTSGRAAEARRHLRLAVETMRTPHPITRLYLARAEMKLGETSAARKRLEVLLDQEGELLPARYSLAMLLRADKRDSEATQELQAIVLKDPIFMPAKQALAR